LFCRCVGVKVEKGFFMGFSLLNNSILCALIKLRDYVVNATRLRRKDNVITS